MARSKSHPGTARDLAAFNKVQVADRKAPKVNGTKPVAVAKPVAEAVKPEPTQVILDTTAKWPGVKAFKVVVGSYALQCPYCAAELVNPADGSHTFTANVPFNGVKCVCGVASYVPLNMRVQA
jgi:hypothetical protein